MSGPALYSVELEMTRILSPLLGLSRRSRIEVTGGRLEPALDPRVRGG
jgi:hypothetical protein